MKYGRQGRLGSGDRHQRIQSSYVNKFTEPFVIFLAIILSFIFVVPAIVLCVLHHVSIGVAIAIAIPCPLLLLAIAAYIRWRLLAKRRARHMHELQPMPGQFRPTLRSTMLHSTSLRISATIDSGGLSKTSADAEMVSPAAFHDDETGLLLTNE